MRASCLFVGSFVAWLFFQSTNAEADELIKEEGTSSLTFNLSRHSEGLGVTDAVEQRTWFELSYEGNCRPGGLRLTKYEQWTEYWFGGGHFGARVIRFVIGVSSVDESGTKVPLYSISAQPDLVEEFEVDSMAFTGSDIQQSNGYLSIRLGPEPYRNYETESGRLLFMSDEPGVATIVTGENPCEEVRYIAHTTFYPKLMSTLRGGDEFVASVSYSSDRGILQTAIVSAPRGWRGRLGLAHDFSGTGQMDFSATRWVYDNYATVVGPRRVDFGSRERAGILLKLGALPETVTVEIPLAEDRMVLEEAQLPAEFSIAEWR
jgi:hypothetical protein